MVECQYKGTGEVVTYSAIYTPGESWIGSKPYVLAIVKLDEGPHPDHTGHLRTLRDQYRNACQESISQDRRGRRSKGMIHYGTKFVPE